MDVKKRSLRRHHRERMIERVRQLQKHVWGTLARYRLFLSGTSNISSHTDPEIDARRLADNLAWCQHIHCQIPRKVFGPTNKEMGQLQDEILQDPCDECGADWNEACERWCRSSRTPGSNPRK